MFRKIVSISLVWIIATHAGVFAQLATFTSARPASCAEALKRGDSAGVYQLYLPDSGLKPFFVYCVPDPALNGSAWTVVQRRVDGYFNFTRDWEEYKHGFGNLEYEFFIGLERLHALTSSSLHELWIQMEDFDKRSAFAKFSSFAVDNEESKYTMHVLGKYYGTAGDSMRHHQGQKFTTMDKDNDQKPDGNCAELFKGGYWYNNCLHNNLNGFYFGGPYKTTLWAQGMCWNSFRGLAYSLKSVQMAIRPVN